MTATALPRRTSFSPDHGKVPSGSEADEHRQSVGKMVGKVLFGRLRQANRMRLWKQNNPVTEAYVPRHLGEPADESAMPAQTEPKHAAGRHAFELADVQAASQSTPHVAGRHAAEVPVDSIQPTVRPEGRHMADVHVDNAPIGPR